MLQPGTQIASNLFPGFKRSVLRVSIPFKRESTSQDEDHGRPKKPVSLVSIPFKRERVSKGLKFGQHTIKRGFPFPSNGKVHRKSTHQKNYWTPVMFPFPSNGKVHRKTPQYREAVLNLMSFHSLQTGKCIASGASPLRAARAPN